MWVLIGGTPCISTDPMCLMCWHIKLIVAAQGLLKLPWTVCLEEKLQYKKYHAKKRPKIGTCVELKKLKFTYITVLKKPKLGLGLMKFLKNYENL